MGTLYLVATPIGNLEDITLRAVRVLREVSLIAAEDTRTTRKLLDRYGIATPTTSYHDHNKRAKLPSLLEALQRGDVALVSEAGTPGLNDPGYELVCAAIERNILVVAAPGPSVVPTALVVSGLPTDQFVYLGYLPRKPGERRRLLASVAGERRTLLCLETPHRLRDALQDILTVLGDRRLAICRELTKLHEEVFRGTASQALAHFQQPRGEFTLVVEGASEEAPRIEEQGLRERLRRLKAQGLSAKEAVARVARDTGRRRREVYQEWVAMGNEL